MKARRWSGGGGPRRVLSLLHSLWGPKPSAAGSHEDEFCMWCIVSIGGSKPEHQALPMHRFNPSHTSSEF